MSQPTAEWVKDKKKGQIMYGVSLPDVKTKKIRTSQVAKRKESSAKDHKLIRKLGEGTQS